MGITEAVIPSPIGDTNKLNLYQMINLVAYKIFKKSVTNITFDEKQLITNELDYVFGNSHRPCTYEDISALKYLECCIKETTRLYPATPVILRQLTQDVNICIIPDTTTSSIV